MIEQFSASASSRLSPSIYLDYGADEHDCSEQGFEICERGMRFNSRWQFSLGTQLAVAFSCHDADGKIQRITTEGIIVDCQCIACKCYLTTLLFIDLPDSLRAFLPKPSVTREAEIASCKSPAPSVPIRGLN